MDRFPLLEEYRLIERSESEVNGAWKGAHILLFFLAFVFGSFCTFCFHMLMYLFDEKCVLFPKLLSMTALRHNIIYEFIPADKDIAENLPVDFLSTQWVDKSACYLPTYVPLVSGIFGLVWTTMFLMCSSGSRTQTGLQRPWRVLPPIFIFSLVMTGICVYASVTTHNGLQELCTKLAEITGSLSCTYTINVATLVYERRIRGVYQATQLTIMSAWLHTLCWFCSALLTLARVLLAVDFQLIRVRVELRCDLDKMLEQHERHVHTVTPDVRFTNINEDTPEDTFSDDSTTFFYRNKKYDNESDTELDKLQGSSSDLLYFSRQSEGLSELSLVPAERTRLARMKAYKSVAKEQQFIVKLVYDFMDTIILTIIPSKESESPTYTSSSDRIVLQSERLNLARHGQRETGATNPTRPKLMKKVVSIKSRESEEIAEEIMQILQDIVNEQIPDTTDDKQLSPKSNLEPPLNIALDVNKDLETDKSSDKTDDSKSKTRKKSNLKQMGIQTDSASKKKDANQKVQITETKEDHEYLPESRRSSQESVHDQDTQTSRKEKQD